MTANINKLSALDLIPSSDELRAMFPCEPNAICSPLTPAQVAEGNDAQLYLARAALWDIGCTLPESELRQAALDALALIERPAAAAAAGRAAWIGAVTRDLKALPEGALPDDSAELMMTESELRAALLRHAPGLPSYSLADYQPGQWWLEKLEALWGSGAVDLDTRRAAKVACNLAAQVFATLGALPQTPPAPAGAGSSSTPRVDALMAKWDDDGATRGAAFCELRDLARELEQDALPKEDPNV